MLKLSKRDRMNTLAERDRHRSLQQQEERKSRDMMLANDKKRRRTRELKILGSIILSLVILSSIFVYFRSTPGQYDNFAKCLTEKGAVMYGEDWCKYTNAQKGMFGKSFKYVNYQVKTGLNKRPTWVINGQSYETVQSFDRLADLTGCKYN